MYLKHYMERLILVANLSIYNINGQVQYGERWEGERLYKGQPCVPCYLLPCKHDAFKKGFGMANYILTAV